MTTKSEDRVWMHCQDTIRKIFLKTGKDALIYAQSALEKESSEPERLEVFWKNAKSFFDDYSAK